MKYTRKINIIQQELNSYQYKTNFLPEKIRNYNQLSNDNFDSFSSSSLLNNPNINNKKTLLIEEECISNINNNLNKNINSYINNNRINSNDLTHYPVKINKMKINENNYLTPNNKQSISNKYLLEKNNNFINPCIESIPDLQEQFISKNITKSNSVNQLGINNKKNLNLNQYILSNFREIINTLKEIKMIKGNVFTNTWEAEEHKKLFYKITSELTKLIKNFNLNEDSNILYSNRNINKSAEKNNNLNNATGQIYNNTEKSQTKISSNKDSHNLTYTFNYHNVNNNNTPNENFLNNKIIQYDTAIKARDLIIEKLKNEIKIKNKTIHSQNLKYNQLKTNLFKKKNNSICKSENIPISKINTSDINDNDKSKMLIVELHKKIKSHEKIEKELKTKLLNYEKNNNKNKSVNNKLKSEPQIENINQKYKDLENNNKILLKSNEDLKQQISILNSKISIKDENENKKEDQKLLFVIDNNYSLNIEGIENKNEEQNILNEETQKLIENLNIELKSNKEQIEQLNSEINKLNKEINKLKNENENLETKNLEIKEKYSIDNKKLQDTIFKQNENIDKYKKIIEIQEKEVQLIKNNTSENEKNDENNSKEESNDNKDLTEQNDYYKKYQQLKMDKDKCDLKNELLKNEYEKIKLQLQENKKLLDKYKSSSNNTIEKNIENNNNTIDNKICELITEHKKEIDELTKKYTQNILNLKINSPLCFSPDTHDIIIDKKFKKFNLHWYLLTIVTCKDKDYENTFWVTENEIKDYLDKFNKFQTEEDIENEKMESIYLNQQKWIKQLDENEQTIIKLKETIKKYETNNNIKIQSDIKTGNNDGYISISQYQKVLEELNQANDKLKKSSEIMKKMCKNEEDKNKIEDIKEVNENNEDENDDENESNETDINKKNYEDIMDRFDKLKTLIKLLIHEMNFSKNVYDYLFDILVIIGYDSDEAKAILNEKAKKGGIIGFFSKK